MNTKLTLAGAGFAGALVALSLAAAPSPAPAPGGAAFEVTVTNLTRGQVFSPLLVATHSREAALFVLGQPASDELATLAEEGDFVPLMASLALLDAVDDVQAGTGPIPPGGSESLVLQGLGGANVVSLASMLVNTNDTFVALDSFPLPTGRSSHTLALAYDAGSERNSEDCDYVPGPACGAAGAHDPAPAEGFVHVSAGVQGNADLDEDAYDWRNPVAEVTIRRLAPGTR